MLVAVALAALACGPPPEMPYVPTAQYARRTVQGWTVRVNRRLLAEERDLGARALELLGAKLLDVRRAVPAPALARLQKVPIWLGVNDGHAPCAEYHPNRQWLVDNGYNPDKARAVEIGSAARFLEWSGDQPSMVLHELAHAYHDQALTDPTDRADLQAAYEAARAGGTYDAVLYLNGETKRAYAMTDVMEYFAEGTEAYFGTNDFYPFVRAELRRHDPRLAALMERLWGRDGARAGGGRGGAREGR